jgi:hypothetical protein
MRTRRVDNYVLLSCRTLLSIFLGVRVTGLVAYLGLKWSTGVC